MLPSEFDLLRDKLRCAAQSYDADRMLQYVETLLARRPPAFVVEHGQLLRLYANWYAQVYAAIGSSIYIWWTESLVERAPLLKAVLPAEIAEYERRELAAIREREESLRSQCATLHAARMAAHRQERLARGLSPQAGSGASEPAINLVATHDLESGELPIGASRFGGLPDLPSDVTWPEQHGKKLLFLAQIDLASVTSSATSVLPPDGWLYVFSLLDDAHMPIPTRVFVWRGPSARLQRARMPLPEEMSCDWANITMYDLVPLTVKQKGDATDDRDGWLFGEMDEWTSQNPGETADALFAEGNDWINLLAITSVGSMQWSDCGHLYLIIRRSDLLRGEFSGVLTTIESS